MSSSTFFIFENESLKRHFLDLTAIHFCMTAKLVSKLRFLNTETLLVDRLEFSYQFSRAHRNKNNFITFFDSEINSEESPPKASYFEMPGSPSVLHCFP